MLNEETNECCGVLSPDSRWVAYASDESGRFEIHKRSFTEARVSNRDSLNLGIADLYRSRPSPNA